MKTNSKKRAEVRVLSPKQEPEKPIAPLIEGILDAVGEDRTRDGLLRTPQRVERAMRYLTSGYTSDVTYLAKDKVIGLSKLPRIVDVFARRLQIQERMTQQVAHCIQDLLDPLGVGVVAEAQHFCMMMRGVEKQHSGTVTSAMLGAFRERKETRDEFLSLIRPK